MDWVVATELKFQDSNIEDDVPAVQLCQSCEADNLADPRLNNVDGRVWLSKRSVEGSPDQGKATCDGTDMGANQDLPAAVRKAKVALAAMRVKRAAKVAPVAPAVMQAAQVKRPRATQEVIASSISPEGD